jgi:hypothetical protein
MVKKCREELALKGPFHVYSYDVIISSDLPFKNCNKKYI